MAGNSFRCIVLEPQLSLPWRPFHVLDSCVERTKRGGYIPRRRCETPIGNEQNYSMCCQGIYFPSDSLEGWFVTIEMKLIKTVVENRS